MILSSADILRVLGGSEIIRLSASLRISDGKPVLSGREGIHIHINRFPSLQEFEATWQIWIEADEEDDLVVAELQRLLPRVQIVRGLMTTATTTEFRSDNTQEAPEAPEPQKAQVNESAIEERFQELAEGIQDQMLLVTSGRAGKDGRNGNDGRDGRDGRDLIATDAELFDLKDVDQSPIPLEKGQVLTWDGEKWTNLFIPKTFSSGGSVVSNGTGSGGGIEEAPTDGRRYVRESAAWSALTPSDTGQGGIEEAPLDGNYYVRSQGKWLNMVSVLDGLGYNRSDVLDGGDFTNETTDATDDAVLDGGDFS